MWIFGVRKLLLKKNADSKLKYNMFFRQTLNSFEEETLPLYLPKLYYASQVHFSSINDLENLCRYFCVALRNNPCYILLRYLSHYLKKNSIQELNFKRSVFMTAICYYSPILTIFSKIVGMAWIVIHAECRHDISSNKKKLLQWHDFYRIVLWQLYPKVVRYWRFR